MCEIYLTLDLYYMYSADVPKYMLYTKQNKDILTRLCDACEIAVQFTNEGWWLVSFLQNCFCCNDQSRLYMPQSKKKKTLTFCPTNPHTSICTSKEVQIPNHIQLNKCDLTDHTDHLLVIVKWPQAIMT